MTFVDAGVVHVDQHASPGQSAVVAIRHGVGRHLHPRPREVAGGLSLRAIFDDMNARQPRDGRQRIHRHAGDQLRTEGGSLLANDDRAHLFEKGLHRDLFSGKKEQVQAGVFRQPLALHRESKQARFELEVGFPRQHGLRLRQRAELGDGRRAGPDQIGVVRHVADDLRPGPPQRFAKRIRQWPARLHDITPRITLGAELRGDGQVQRSRRVQQGVAQQDALVRTHQLIEILRRVGETMREVVARDQAGGIGLRHCRSDGSRGSNCGSGSSIGRGRSRHCGNNRGVRRRAFGNGAVALRLLAFGQLPEHAG